jgi:4-hydroxy-3-polyprenylbenzoate decarboxylase
MSAPPKDPPTPTPAPNATASAPEAGGPRELALLLSGASGAQLALALGRTALEHAALDTLHIALTPPALRVVAVELGPSWASPGAFRDRLAEHALATTTVRVWEDDDLCSPLASGSHPLLGTVVLPCSAGMAAAIATGISRGLVQRAADVALKQRWPLVVGIRETPLSQVVLRNLLLLAQAGAHVVPPIPAFYLKPDPATAWQRYLDHYSLRVLDLLGIRIAGDGLRWRS